MQTVINAFKQNKPINYSYLRQVLKDTQEYKCITGFYYETAARALEDYKKYKSLDYYIKSKNKELIKKKNLDTLREPHPKKYTNILISHPPMDSNKNLILPKTKLTPEIVINIPKCYKHIIIIRAIIRPSFHFQIWDLILEYEVQQDTRSNLDYSNALAIDLGIDNYVTAVTTQGQSFILDGRRLKSILQGYCKYKAYLRKKSNNKFNTKRLISLHRKTFARTNDYMRRTVNYVIKYCKQNNINCVVLGWGIHFQSYNLGLNNQIYNLFPFATLKQFLKWKCTQNNIKFLTTDESYTSKASFMDGDIMPPHVTPIKQVFSGKRKYRGLYITKNGTKINADINATANIMIKSKAVTSNEVDVLRCRGIMQPRRIYYPFKLHTASN